MTRLYRVTHQMLSQRVGRTAAVGVYPPVARHSTTASALFLIFAFALPASLNPTLYAALMITASLFVSVPQLKVNPSESISTEYLVLVALLFLYLVWSYIGLLPRSGFYYDRSRVIKQAAGWLLVVSTYPAFVVVGRSLQFGRRGTAIVVVAAALGVISSSAFSSSNVISGGQLYGAKAAAILLQFGWFLVALSCRTKTFQVLIILLPFPLLGSATNLLVELAFVAVLLTGGHRAVPIATAIAMLIFCALMVSSPDWFARLIASDPNTVVRSRFWHAAVPEILRHPLGLGFGTTYTDMSARFDPYIFNAYSANLSRAFDVANHNTFIDTLLRLGLFGFCALLTFLFNSWRHVRGHHALLLSSALLSITVVVCALNPIIESAQSALFVAFAVGCLRAARVSSAVMAPGQSPFSVEERRSQSPSARRRQLAALADD